MNRFPLINVNERVNGVMIVAWLSSEGLAYVPHFGISDVRTNHKDHAILVVI